ncbi:MAG: CRISPR-associated ring nuclease Csm6 [Candidatus Omnitrophica bacterium]|nr:CRISPR-associated ring nuclease Csm6 [Candidatus Omnitrophota bacterium]
MKNILFCISGMSPQVITETLYVLLIEKKIEIEEVWALTTEKGKKLISELILDKKNGAIYKFYEDFKLQPKKILFNSDQIIVCKDSKGNYLKDIRNEDDNRQIANHILQIMKTLTEDPLTQIHGSVAGGRKTMSVYLALAFQALARNQDHLYHILVDPPELEGSRDFFYPVPGVKSYQVHGKNIPAERVKLELAEIPFLKLREHIPAIKDLPNSWEELVMRMQSLLTSQPIINPVEIILEKNKKAKFKIGEKEASLQDKWIMLYLFFIKKKQNFCKENLCQRCGNCFLRIDDIGEQFSDETKEEYKYIKGEFSGYTEQDKLKLDREQIRSYISKINREIKKTTLFPEFYIITSIKKWGETKYGIYLSPSLFRYSRK